MGKFIGRCEACGNLCEVENVELKMVKSKGCWGGVTFHLLLCAGCQGRVFRRKVNSLLACGLGVACAFVPFFWTPEGMWLVRGAIELVFLGLMVLVLGTFFTLLRGNGRLIERDRDYQSLKGAAYHLANNLFLWFLTVLMLAFGTTSALVWAGASRIHARQDGWAETLAKVTHSDELVVAAASKGSGETVWRLLAKFRYTYEVDGVSYAGTGCEYRFMKGNAMARNLRPAGSCVRVFYDPGHPESSVAHKVNVDPFQKCLFGAGILAAISLLVGVFRRLLAN